MRTQQHGVRSRASRLGVLFVAASAFLSGVPLVAQEEAIEQWVFSVVGISSGVPTSDGAPESIVAAPQGTCDLVDGEDFNATSWRTGTPDRGEEWIEVRYQQPVFATAVEVHQSINPGAVTRILVRDLEGRLHEVWAGTAPGDACPAVLRADFERLSFPINTLRVELNTALVPGFNQIDAVKLVGAPVTDFEPLFIRLDPSLSGRPPVHSEFDSRVAADLDNDGWPDIVARHSGPVPTVAIRFIQHNQGDGTFRFRGPILPTPETAIMNGGPVAADFDNDGDLDLFLAIGDVVGAVPFKNLLLRNDRGTFVDATDAAGLHLEGISAAVISFDYDRDGFLDLYVGNWTFPVGDEPSDRLAVRAAQQNRLYRNNGDLTFADVTAQAGLEAPLHRPDSPHLGGSANGMLAADFDDDGWTDLYVVVPSSPNRLFFNRQGVFVEEPSTARTIGLVADSFGAGAGDVDNDGDLDLFQGASFGQSLVELAERLPERSTLFLNLGDAQFADATEGVGLGALNVTSVAFPRLFDFDNDTDLDLFFLTALFFEHRSLLSFAERPFQAGLPAAELPIDFDQDGFIDVSAGSELFRNRGATGHYLSVDLVGTQSNRDGIGATVFATLGDVRLRRDLMAGDGWWQTESQLHFGLGAVSTVDQLEIRWPSGQVDRINNIPADQRIRVIEGRSAWLPAPRTVWEKPPPADLAYGESARFRAVVRPALFEPAATITQITADLSGLGGPEEVPLEDLGDGTYAFDADFTVGGDAVMRDVEVFILQETSLGEHWINLSRNITVNDDPFTAVLEAYDSTTPEAFTLNKNYPNPFNSGTVIPFALPAGGEVELAVFNLAGQKVATLIKGYREAGQYKITWDGRDDAGNALATGMYLYRLHSDAHHKTQKLLLLR